MPKRKEDDFYSSEELSIAAHVDYRILPCTGRAKKIIGELANGALINDELLMRKKSKIKSTTYRKRPKEMLERLTFCLELYLSNLIYLSFDYGLDASLRVTRSKREYLDYRYNPEAFTRGASIMAQDILRLPENALISVFLGARDPSGRHSIQTILKPSERLLEAVKTLSRSDFKHNTPLEVIILKSKLKTDNDFSKKPKGKWSAYDDTDYTNAARKQIESLNEFLSQADIKFFGVDIPQGERQLKRYFNESFDSGGRLFGGSWQAASKISRAGFTINGEECVEIDFQACGLRLAYARAGLDLSDQYPNDPYKYIGYARAGVKKMLSAMLCSRSPMKKFLKGFRDDLKVGKHVKVGLVTKTIEQRFAPIAHLFYRGIGLELMHTESEILIEALLTLQSKGIVALPIHDCVVVAESDQAVAQEVMLEAFLKVSGQSGKVDVKSL